MDYESNTDRRTLLRTGLLAALGMLTLPTSPLARAQPEDVVKMALDPEMWMDDEKYLEIYWLTTVSIGLRVAYNGPNEYEAGEQFRQGVWDAWNRVFGGPISDGLKISNDIIQPYLMKDTSNLEDHLNKKRETNGESFLSWLQTIGVTESPLRDDLFRAQAFFAVGAFAVFDVEDFDFFSNTWIYPFC